MRKLLLGSTAVAAAAIFAPGGAAAQTLSTDAFASSNLGAPLTSMRNNFQVRLGGFYKAMYNRTTQSLQNDSTTRLGNSDFSNEIEIHILAAGKAANGLTYGVALEIENDIVRSPAVAPNAQGISGSGKSLLGFDEAWAYLAGPWGQVRFGDEDGALQQLQSGHVTGFGVGGLDSGDLNQQIVNGNIRSNFTMVNDPGDNTKVIYLSPQFFGFDAGASFAFNTGEGSLSGCDSLATAATCDRVSALAGGSTRRRNEIQAALRWRGSFGPVGLSATVAYLGADAVRNTTGPSAERIDTLWAGAVVTAYGFTVGGWYQNGTMNAGYNTIQSNRDGGGNTFSALLGRNAPGNARDDRNLENFMVGVTYTIDAVTVGGHFNRTLSAGSQTIGTGGRRETGFAVGGNYRIAPGLDLFAEYNQTHRKERGFNIQTNSAVGVGGTTTAAGSVASVFLTGFRVAF